jgi:hypothetical protein
LLDRLEDDTLADLAGRYGEEFNSGNRSGAALKNA